MHPCVRPGCGAVFERPYRLAAHLLTHDNKKGFKCAYENCGREYTSNSHLLRHFESAHKTRDKTAEFKCPLCWCVYSNRQNLKRHFNAHINTTSALYTCEACCAQFSKKHILTAHMYNHTNVKGFNCEHCSRSFITLREKKRHLEFHKTYQCEECKEFLQNWSEYQEHRKKHYREKEFICHHCDKNFKVRTQIVRHMKMHDEKGKKCFLCPMYNCSKFYTTKFNLQQHYRSAHEYRTFDCSVCEAKLATKAKLNNHMARHSTVENKEIIKIKINRPRKERKDKGIPKEPVAAKIAGINFIPQWQDLIDAYLHM